MLEQTTTASGDSTSSFKAIGYKICDAHCRYNDEDYFTQSSTEQKRVEETVEEALADIGGHDGVTFERNAHIRYVLSQLMTEPLTPHLSASRVWCCFWGVHALRMLGTDIPEKVAKSIVDFLKCCQNADGGFGGGPGQLSHLATTYAGVMALASIGTNMALDSIDRRALLRFLVAMKQSNGAFSMHEDGEIDVRGAYCAIAIAVMCNIGTEPLFERAAEWVMRCRSYEGGFGGEPHCEAHGGYTFCAVAALALLQKTHLLDDEALTRWLLKRQMRYEGGFQGRVGKLVDACYSYWLAAACFVSEAELQQEWQLPARGSLFNSTALQQYVVAIAQSLPTNGGFADKPERNPDLYHSCYALAGLALAQQTAASESELVGGSKTAVQPINPLFNVETHAAQHALDYFVVRPLPDKL